MFSVVMSRHVMLCLDLPVHACKVLLGQTRFGRRDGERPALLQGQGYELLVAAHHFGPGVEA